MNTFLSKTSNVSVTSQGFKIDRDAKRIIGRLVFNYSGGIPQYQDTTIGTFITGYDTSSSLFQGGVCGGAHTTGIWRAQYGSLIINMALACNSTVLYFDYLYEVD